MMDFTADHISNAEGAELLSALQSTVTDDRLQFVPGVSYRNLLIYRGRPGEPAPFSLDTRTRAPHDLTDLPITDDFPRGPGSDMLVELMNRSVPLFATHPVNKARIAAGKRPATNVWLWGLGGSPSLTSFHQRYGLKGAMITAVDLLRGLAVLVGWDNIAVEGATGYLDTNYRGKGQAAIEALKKYDVVTVHIEAPDEASHEGAPTKRSRRSKRSTNISLVRFTNISSRSASIACWSCRIIRPPAPPKSTATAWYRCSVWPRYRGQWRGSVQRSHCGQFPSRLPTRLGNDGYLHRGSF